MKDYSNNKIIKKIMIKKDELKQYFNNKKIIKKSEYIKYLKEKNKNN